MKTITIILALLIALPVLGEESSNVAECYVGINVLGYKECKDDPNNRYMSIKRKGNKVNVLIRDYFMCDGPLEMPYIMDIMENKVNKATLNIGVERPKLFATGCQKMMELTISIDRPWLKKGVILYIYNKDDGNVLGHMIVP